VSVYLNNIDSDWFKHRLNGIFFIIIAAVVILLSRLFYLQVLNGEEYRRLSENNCIRLQSIEPSRGLIYDTSGRLLVDNRPTYDLCVIVRDAKPLKETIKNLASYIQASEFELMNKVKSKKGLRSYKPIVLIKNLDRDLLSIIEARKYDLPGILIKVRPKRFYIHQSASHLIGYLGEVNVKELKSKDFDGVKSGDDVGKFGIEKEYETELRGFRGGRQVEVNSKGQVVRVLKTVKADPGYNIYLTLNLNLQMKTEELLQGKVGAAVAMNPETGEILALASSPTFNQNDFIGGISHSKWQALIENPDRPMSNKAIQGEYPPGSTYKIVTAMAALEENTIDENTKLFCGGKLTFGNRDFRCWNWKTGGHGNLDVVGALTESCDVFFYQVAQKLGVDKLAWYARASGLGYPTEISLDHEADGLVPTAEWKRQVKGVPWRPGETLNISIGQGYNLVTPLQILSLTAAVGNEGLRFKPRLIKVIKTADGSQIFESKPEVSGKLPVSKKNLDLIRKGLWRVVNSDKGSARNVAIKGVHVSGKTGTSQVVSRKLNEPEPEVEAKKVRHHRAHALFVAYAPSVHPEIAVSVIIDHGNNTNSENDAKGITACISNIKS